MPETSAAEKCVTLDTYTKAMQAYHKKAQAAWQQDITNAGGSNFVAATEEEVLKVIDDIFAPVTEP